MYINAPFIPAIIEDKFTSCMKLRWKRIDNIYILIVPPCFTTIDGNGWETRWHYKYIYKADLLHLTFFLFSSYFPFLFFYLLVLTCDTRIRWLFPSSKAIRITQMIRIAHHCVSNVVDRAHYDGTRRRTRKRGGEGGREAGESRGERGGEAGIGLEGGGRGGCIDVVGDCQCSFFYSFDCC